jgi:hypothetical protein
MRAVPANRFEYTFWFPAILFYLWFKDAGKKYLYNHL